MPGGSVVSVKESSPAMPDAYAFLLQILAGSDQLTVSGTTDPISLAP